MRVTVPALPRGVFLIGEVGEGAPLAPEGSSDCLLSTAPPPVAVGNCRYCWYKVLEMGSERCVRRGSRGPCAPGRMWAVGGPATSKGQLCTQLPRGGGQRLPLCHLCFFSCQRAMTDELLGPEREDHALEQSCLWKEHEAGGRAPPPGALGARVRYTEPVGLTVAWTLLSPGDPGAGRRPCLEVTRGRGALCERKTPSRLSPQALAGGLGGAPPGLGVRAHRPSSGAGRWPQGSHARCSSAERFRFVSF